MPGPTIFARWPKRRRDAPGRINRPPGLAWGDFVPSRGCSRCFRCHFPWGDIGTKREPRIVNYTSHNGCFAFCKHCWPKTSFVERIRGFAQLFREQARINGERRSELIVVNYKNSDEVLVRLSERAPHKWVLVYEALCEEEVRERRAEQLPKR